MRRTEMRRTEMRRTEMRRTEMHRDAKNRDAKNRDAKNRDAKNRSRKREKERERERKMAHAVKLPQGRGDEQKALLSPWRGRGRHSFFFWRNSTAQEEYRLTLGAF